MIFPLTKIMNVIDQLLSRSPNTKRAYEKVLKNFFEYTTGCLPDSNLVLEFLQLKQARAVALVLKYSLNSSQLELITKWRQISE